MPELALRLIEENKKTRATFLDLANCGLTEVPAEIGELVWLESIAFSMDWRVWDGNRSYNIRSSNLWCNPLPAHASATGNQHE